MSCSRVSRAQAVGIVLIVLAALAVILLTGSCAAVRLERRLAPDVREWYRNHEILMQTAIPFAGGIVECKYFLALPPDQQLRYIQMFWKIRDPLAEQLFKARLDFVRRFVTHFRFSAIAEQVILCGLPDDVELYNPITGKYITTTTILQDHGYSRVTAIWTYYYLSLRVDFGWEKTGGQNWYPCPLSAEAAGEQKKFQDWCRAFFAPTWNGWDLWEEGLK